MVKLLFSRVDEPLFAPVMIPALIFTAIFVTMVCCSYSLGPLSRTSSMKRFRVHDFSQLIQRAF